MPTPDARSRSFDFGNGPALCVPLSFGDLVTAWHSIRIPNIAMYAHLAEDAFPRKIRLNYLTAQALGSVMPTPLAPWQKSSGPTVPLQVH